MLLKLLKSWWRSKRTLPSHLGHADTRFPIEYLHDLRRLHERAPIDFHSEILFGDVKVGNHSFLELFKKCLSDSGTGLSSWKYFIRTQSAINLYRYYCHSLGVEGLRAECGVFMGFSALLMNRAAKLNDPEFSGENLYLIDSFSGFSEPVEKDHISVHSSEDDLIKKGSAFGAGAGSAPHEHVQQLMSEFPGTSVIKGWIPSVFSVLPDKQWAFVHIDVDLYEPTRDCLQWFYPRMVKGGILICDDYGSMLFPGAKKAWDEFFHGIQAPFVILETGQSVYVK